MREAEGCKVDEGGWAESQAEMATALGRLNNMSEIRVGFPPQSTDPCLFQGPMPSRRCRFPGVDESFMMVVGQALFGDLPVRFVPVTGWSFSSQTPFDPADTSIMGATEKGVIDFTIVSLRASRSERLGQEGHVLVNSDWKLVYQERANADPIMDLNMLLISPWVLWVEIFTLGALGILVGLCHARFGKDSTPLLKLRERSTVVIWVLVGLLLSILGNLICIFYSVPVALPQLVRNVEDLYDQMEQGRMTVVTNLELTAKLVLNPQFARSPEQYRSVEESNPPILVPTHQEILDYLQRQDRDRQYITITSERSVLMQMYLKRMCLAVFVEVPEIAPVRIGIYHRPGLVVELPSVTRRFLDFAGDRLNRVYARRRGSVQQEAEACGGTTRDFTLTFYTTSALFYIFAGLSICLGIGSFVWEWLYYKILSVCFDNQVDIPAVRDLRKHSVTFVQFLGDTADNPIRRKSSTVAANERRLSRAKAKVRHTGTRSVGLGVSPGRPDKSGWF